MLKIQRIATAIFCNWSTKIAKPKSTPTLPTNLTHEHAFEGWVEIDESLSPGSASPCSNPSLGYSGDSECNSHADLRFNVPTTGPALSSTTLATDAHALDTETFPPHAMHLLPSDQNGTRRTHASYALKNSNESASTFREVLEQHAHEIDVPALLHKLEQIAEECKDNINDWLNQKFAYYDLVKMHNQVRRLVPVISKPNIRQVDQTVNTVTEIVQSLRKRRSEAELLNMHYNKYTFAHSLGEKARASLIEQGICKEWQFLNEEHAKTQHVMHTALVHTFTRVQESYPHVPLHRAIPQWLADRDLKVWRLELDVGVVGVEVGPESDRSLVELGYIDTGFTLPESYGCVRIEDVDRQAQVVEDEW